MAAGQKTGEWKKVSATVPETEQVTIRKCDSIDEFTACVALQKEVWNFDDRDLVPLRMFVVSQKIGGQIIGAFTGRDLVGFALSIPGARGGHAYLHSHMLAVRESWRNHGVGRRLKLAQRDDGIERGFELIEWTFDPLEIKNAHLNIVRLGAIARRYSVDHYGSSSSPLQGGLPTDRLVAEWWLKSERVMNTLERKQGPKFPVEKRISVPAQIYVWKAADATRQQAADVQTRNREEFLAAFPGGLTVLDYERDAQGNGTFLLGHWNETWSYGPVVDHHPEALLTTMSSTIPGGPESQ
jgi:predicted GNAT superfamily acetyltransferase